MSLDVALFKLLNVAWGSEPLAPFMKVMSDLSAFVPAIALLVVWMAIRGGLRGRVTVLALLVCVPLTDQVSSHLLKPLVDRPRPCRPESGIENVNTYGVGCSGRGSFPSSHAANIGGAAALVGIRHRAWALPAAFIAYLVGYSRVFLGVHYPFDVLAGWILGGGFGWGIARLAGLGEGRWRRRRTSAAQEEPETPCEPVDTSEPGT